jgi:hypothetical protein
MPALKTPAFARLPRLGVSQKRSGAGNGAIVCGVTTNEASLRRVSIASSGANKYTSESM